MSKLKKNCTADEWAIHIAARRAYVNGDPKVKAAARAATAAWKKSEKGKAAARAYEALPHVKLRRQAKDRKRSTGMTRQLFEDLMVLQAGKCGACGVAFDMQRRPHADHCHDTGSHRGLLCRSCNLAEGHIKQTGLSPAEFARRLALYLAKPPADLI